MAWYGMYAECVCFSANSSSSLWIFFFFLFFSWKHTVFVDMIHKFDVLPNRNDTSTTTNRFALSLSFFGYNSHSFTLCACLFSARDGALFWLTYTGVASDTRSHVCYLHTFTLTHTLDTQTFHTNARIQAHKPICTHEHGRDWHFIIHTHLQSPYNSVMCACMLVSFSFVFSSSLHHHQNIKKKSFIFFTFSPSLAHTNVLSMLLVISVFINSTNLIYFFPVTLENF